MLIGKCLCVCMCVFTYWKRFFLSLTQKKPHSSPKHLSLKNKSQDHSMSFWTSVIIWVVFFFLSISQFSNKHLRGCCPSFKSIWKILSCCDGCKRCNNWQAAAVLKLVFVVLISFSSCFLVIPRWLFVPAYCLCSWRGSTLKWGCLCACAAASEEEY